MPRVLLDANIWLDFLEANRESHALAEKLISELYDQDYELCIAATSLKDIYYIITRHLNETEARRCVGILLKTTTLLAVDTEIVEKAYGNAEPDLEDGIIRAVAETSRVAFFVTRDRTGFKGLSIPKVGPSQMLGILASSNEARTHL